MPIADDFSFFDLIQLKKVRDLRAKRVRPAVIRESLTAMQKQVAGMENPLLEASAFSVGNRVAFRHEGRAVEPIAGQFVMEFEPMGAVVSAKVARLRPSTRWLTCLRAGWRSRNTPAPTMRPSRSICGWWNSNRTMRRRTSIWVRCITTGRISLSAETHYRVAVKADPRYALAYFDLGNVLDETGRLEEAIAAYRTAIQLAPTYADAHYNLALAYERLQQPRRALPHWKTYAQARPDRTVVGARAQPNCAHPRRRHVEDGLSATRVTRSLPKQLYPLVCRGIAFDPLGDVGDYVFGYVARDRVVLRAGRA